VSTLLDSIKNHLPKFESPLPRLKMEKKTFYLIKSNNIISTIIVIML